MEIIDWSFCRNVDDEEEGSEEEEEEDEEEGHAKVDTVCEYNIIINVNRKGL